MSVVLVGLALGGCTSRPSAAGPDSSASGGQLGGDHSGAISYLPDFELETLGGGSERLGDHLGQQVILIDFWATFCDACLVAMPHLQELYEKYEEEGFVVLGVSIDGPESVARVRSEVKKLGVEFPILLDQESEALALYNPKSSAPYSILIGKDGTILKKKEGFTPTDVPALERAIVAALSDVEGTEAALDP